MHPSRTVNFRIRCISPADPDSSRTGPGPGSILSEKSNCTAFRHVNVSMRRTGSRPSAETQSLLRPFRVPSIWTHSQSFQLNREAGIRNARPWRGCPVFHLQHRRPRVCYLSGEPEQGSGCRDLESGGVAVRDLSDPAGGGAYGSHTQGSAGEVNLSASAFPAACRGVSERISDVSSLQIEDSPPLAAGSFNGSLRPELILWSRDMSDRGCPKSRFTRALSEVEGR